MYKVFKKILGVVCFLTFLPFFAVGAFLIEDSYKEWKKLIIAYFNLLVRNKQQ